jgi:hypothetical protein
MRTALNGPRTKAYGSGSPGVDEEAHARRAAGAGSSHRQPRGGRAVERLGADGVREVRDARGAGRPFRASARIEPTWSDGPMRDGCSVMAPVASGRSAISGYHPPGRRRSVDNTDGLSRCPGPLRRQAGGAVGTRITVVSRQHSSDIDDVP